MTTPSRLAVPPLQMDAETAAQYVGERSRATFLSRVGEVYPRPTARLGRRDLWLRGDLEKAVDLLHGRGPSRLAEDL